MIGFDLLYLPHNLRGIMMLHSYGVVEVLLEHRLLFFTTTILYFLFHDIL